MTSSLHFAPNAYRGFTLVELMVTLVIIAILSSLSLAGLNGARQRSKLAKTQSTLRKLDDEVSPLYDSYLRRRITTVPIAGLSPSLARLCNKRLLIAREMPDVWHDVFDNPAVVNSGSDSFLKTAAVRSYAAVKNSIASPRRDDYGNAECLFLIVSRSGMTNAGIEAFRADEIADIDQDTAQEFVDGWGRPIRYIRWAPGFSSPIQPLDTPDPMDVTQESGTSGNRDRKLVPLIFSSGPDGAGATGETDGYGITGPPATGWTALPLTPLTTTRPSSLSPQPGFPSDQAAARDNLTNHDLINR